MKKLKGKARARARRAMAYPAEYNSAKRTWRQPEELRRALALMTNWQAWAYYRESKGVRQLTLLAMHLLNPVQLEKLERRPGLVFGL